MSRLEVTDQFDAAAHTEHLRAVVEAEEFAGGPMTRTPGVGPTLDDLFGPRPKPQPAGGDGPKPTIWVVKQTSGGNLRVLAEWHITYARPEGSELRFHNGDDKHPVATVRAGSWHSCVAESALEPKAGEE
ncbi:hypothetical protein [Dietzia cercidiphylli]|uniref:Uncharacterized protein n=1 Tax=Dietzia cercidiphylli TaxID=498199 RepID=A0ABP4VFC4_9ACTN|nr:hypothetical protein [Dietzia cercidiphylli]MBB1046429.1 hypothetical protein [Dietzia cercidiphylli]